MDDELKESSAGEMNQVPLAGVRILFTSTLFVGLFVCCEHSLLSSIFINYHTNQAIAHFCIILQYTVLGIIFLNIIFLT